MRALFGPCRGPPSCNMLIWSCLSECPYRERFLSFSSQKATTKPVGLELHPYDLLNLSYLLKVLSPTTVTMGIRTSTQKCEGYTIPSTAMSEISFPTPQVQSTSRPSIFLLGDVSYKKRIKIIIIHSLSPSRCSYQLPLPLQLPFNRKDNYPSEGCSPPT